MDDTSQKLTMFTHSLIQLQDPKKAVLISCGIFKEVDTKNVYLIFNWADFHFKQVKCDPKETQLHAQTLLNLEKLCKLKYISIYSQKCYVTVT